MVVVADGNITGRGENMSTPQILAKILGFDIDEKEDATYSYRCIGKLRKNLANVYFGTYEKGGKSLKYIVIVKCGVESEQGSGRSGNRGKRDSQLIITGLFNRIHHERELCALDTAINQALNTLQVPGYEIEHLMTIDADTRVEASSIHHIPTLFANLDAAIFLGGHSYGAPSALLASQSSKGDDIAGLILHDPALGMGYNQLELPPRIPTISYTSDEYNRAGVRCGDVTYHVEGAFHGNFVDAPLWAPLWVMRTLSLLIPACGPADPNKVHQQLAESARAFMRDPVGMEREAIPVM